MDIISQLDEYSVGAIQPLHSECPVSVRGMGRQVLVYKDAVLDEIKRNEARSTSTPLAEGTPNTVQGYYLLPEFAKMLSDIKRFFPAYQQHLTTSIPRYIEAPDSDSLSYVGDGYPVATAKTGEVQYVAGKPGLLATTCVFTHPNSDVVQGILSVRAGEKYDTDYGHYRVALRTDDFLGYEPDGHPAIQFWSPRICKHKDEARNWALSKHPSTVMRTVKKCLANVIGIDEVAPALENFHTRVIEKLMIERTSNTKAALQNQLDRDLGHDRVKEALVKWAQTGVFEAPEEIRSKIVETQKKIKNAEGLLHIPHDKLLWVVYRLGDKEIITGYRFKRLKTRFSSGYGAEKAKKVVRPAGSINDMHPSMMEAMARVQMLDYYDYVPDIGFRDDKMVAVLADADAVPDAKPCSE